MEAKLNRYCEPCDRHFTSEQHLRQHEEGRQHYIASFQAKRRQLRANKKKKA